MTETSLPIQTVDVQQVARILNCSPKTVLDKAGMGELRGAKIGKSWFFRLEDIKSFINAEIERQTEARKNRYTTAELNHPLSRARSYSKPVKKKQAYPDLTPYRQLLKS